MPHPGNSKLHNKRVASKPEPETFAMGRFGTVVPCSTTTPLSDELVMLGRLIGTHDRRGTAEARGIVERALSEMDGNTVLDGFNREHGCTPSMMASDRDTWRARAEAAEAALRAVLPYAESRLEDMRAELESAASEDDGYDGGERRRQAASAVTKAEAAFEAAKAAIARAEDHT